MDFFPAETELVGARSRPRFLFPALCLTLIAALFPWSANQPADPAFFWAHALPVLVGVGILLATARRFPLTRLAYGTTAAAAALLLVRGHFPSSGVPFTAELRDSLGLAADPFGVLTELVLGFVTALLAREVLLRRSPLVPGRWLTFLVLATSVALFDLLRLAVRTTGVLLGGLPGELAERFTRGPTDGPLLVLLGAALALISMQGAHDRQLLRTWMRVTRAVGWHRV